MSAIISLWIFLEWLFYGLLRYVLVWIPVVKPYPVDRGIPAWWFRYNTWNDWARHLDRDKRPDLYWCQQWLEMCFGEFARMVNHAANSFTERVGQSLQNLIGYIRAGYASLGQWLDSVERRVGAVLPWFAENVGHGLGFLFNLLPAGIRGRYQSWDDLFRGIRDGAVRLVRGLIDEARRWAADSLNWVTNQGRRIYDFYVDCQAFVRRFKNDPYGMLSAWLGQSWTWLVSFAASPVGAVLSWLGPDWRSWVTFNAGPARFLYNLWSAYHDDIAALFADPRGWVYERLEDALTDRW